MTERSATPFLLGDWGTSRLRLYKCIEQGGRIIVLSEAAGPGVKFAGDFEAALFDTAATLGGAGAAVFLSGMVGSTIGWADAGYVPCPARFADFASASRRLLARGAEIFIAPGASCRNRHGLPDIMRGEETQLAGLTPYNAPTDEKRLICLPGTHCKWAIADGRRLFGFETTLQGELFEVVVKHTVLGKDVPASCSIASNAAGFERGVDLMAANRDLPLSQALFSARSLRVTAALGADEVAAYLSGLTIAADVRDTGLGLYEREGLQGPVVLVGDDALMALYAAALGRFGIDARCVNGRDAVLAGLGAFRKAIIEGALRDVV